MFKQVRANLRSENLVAGFRSSGICPIDCNQMLKKIPGANRGSGGPETNSERNESVKALLRSHCGIAVEQRKTRSRKKEESCSRKTDYSCYIRICLSECVIGTTNAHVACSFVFTRPFSN